MLYVYIYLLHYLWRNLDVAHVKIGRALKTKFTIISLPSYGKDLLMLESLLSI